MRHHEIQSHLLERVTFFLSQSCFHMPLACAYMCQCVRPALLLIALFPNHIPASIYQLQSGSKKKNIYVYVCIRPPHTTVHYQSTQCAALSLNVCMVPQTLVLIQ